MKLEPFATTAMSILPHTDARRALDLALSLDVPFWPQLPRLGFAEDMYVQTLNGFPGVSVDLDNSRISFKKTSFYEQLDTYLSGTSPGIPRSATYRSFADEDLSGYQAVRGQVMGPISCGFRLIDESKKPVIYDDEVRQLLLQHIARQASFQLMELARRNRQALVFIDEPGLAMVFSGLSGYNETRAQEDLRTTLGLIEGPAGIHLCGRPDWDFLLRLPIELLSFNAFAMGDVFVSQTEGIRRFLSNGSVICWGMVPTSREGLERFSVDELGERLSDLLQRLVDDGVDRALLLGQSALAPSTCNLAGTPLSVEIAFENLRELSRVMAGKRLA